jgi:geranylgeranyl diphosphate synthase, type II
LTILESASQNELLAQRKSEIEKRLALLIERPADLPQYELFAAAKYSLLAPGKRLRPLLALSITESYNIPIEHVITPISALEMVHTYSLIHDDLPCMDNDDERRGRPSLHKVYSEAHALLAGNLLLTLAFELLATSEHLSERQRLLLIQTLARGAGGNGMMGGQMIDIAASGKTIDWETLKCMHIGKTAKMLSTSLAFGGILANLEPQEITRLEEIGEKLGLAFQIVDDILDITGSEIARGKKSGSDLKNNKPTAANFLGLEHAQKSAEELYASAQTLISSLPTPLPLLETLAHKLVFRAS